MWNFDKIKAPKLRRYQPYNNQSNNSIIISWYIPYYSARMPKQNFLLCWWYFYRIFNIENQTRFGCRAVFYLYVSIYAMYAHNPALIVVLFANLFVTYIYITFISNTLLYSWRKQSSSVRWCWAVHLWYILPSRAPDIGQNVCLLGVIIIVYAHSLFEMRLNWVG